MTHEVTSSKVGYITINTIDNTIDIRGYRDIIKVVRVTIFVIKFVKNLFREIKGDYLNLDSYVDATEFYEAKVRWVKTHPLSLLKNVNYEHLLKNLSLKFDEESTIRFYGFLQNKTENKHSPFNKTCNV